MELPVYLFTGFLESGKTKFIADTLSDDRFNEGESTLLIVCEEGIEEYDLSKYGDNVHLIEVEKEEELSPAFFSKLEKTHKAKRAVIEYNGMWPLSSLFNNLPSNWMVYQEVFFADASTILSYNANMRSLVVDKLNSPEMVAFNRVPEGADVMPFHKLVRGINTRAEILYEHIGGRVEYDNIEDPPPYNKESEIVEIEDKDYAIFYRDVAENSYDWNGKTVCFKGIVAKDKDFPENTVLAGRHVMTCCVDDIKYLGLALKTDMAKDLKSYDWIKVKARISLEYHRLYRSKGPVLYALEVTEAEKPSQPVATFY